MLRSTAWMMLGALVLSVMIAQGEAWESLPIPATPDPLPVERAIAQRRSIRRFSSESIEKAIVSRLLWSAQGITDTGRNLRASPSAGATYPLELYWVQADGVYHYRPEGHAWRLHRKGDVRDVLGKAALGQRMVAEAPGILVISAVMSRTSRRYGEQRGERYVWMEVGHAAQNVHLQAIAFELGSVPVGAFRDAQVSEALELPDAHTPLYLIPIGFPR